MIAGIGLDIVEIKRIADLLEHQPRFPERVLSDNELAAFGQLSGRRKIEFLAGRFAAKEAFAKAFGTGIGESLSFRDIEVAASPLGQPKITAPVSEYVHLSITHTKEYAAAQVILEKQ